MEQYSLSFMRESCDKYQDGRGCPCPAWVTQFNVDKNERCWDAAKLALNIYNQEEQKNFNLEKVWKLNFIAIYFCMTFRAKNAETDECRFFRGVVDGLSDTVLLCEIMEPDDIAILSDPVENYVEALSECKEDNSPYPLKRARIELDLGDDYVYSHSFVVSGGVNEGVMAGPDVAVSGGVNEGVMAGPDVAQGSLNKITTVI